MHIDAQIKPIEQWPGKPPSISLERSIGTTTRSRNNPFTAGTRIHGSNQEKASRQFHTGFSSGQSDLLTACVVSVSRM